MPRTILVVDDELMNRDILVNMLSREYSVLTASGGMDALDMLRQKHTLISAVLLDLKMPQMDGFEVLKAIRDDVRFRAIPVIVVTALTDQNAEEKAVSLGAYGFVTKPYKSVLIRRHLSNAISFREAATLRNIIRRDDLTKIMNLRGFSEQAEALIRSQPVGYYVLSCFDVDSFKVINDQYGTEKGDEVLKFIATILTEAVTRIGGISCRISSDDFATLYPAVYLGCDVLEQAYQVAVAPTCISRTISLRIGRYLVEDTSISISAMYDRAVLARESIRGRYDAREAIYDDKMREHLLEEQQIVNEMGNALAENQFEVWLQPQFNYSSGALIGAEALARWRHPQRGMIAPYAFIPVFERNGFIYSLDKYIWEQVCVCLRKWLDQGRNPLPVSVNISREDIAKDDIADVLYGLVRKYDLDISLLRLEITETAFAQSTARVADVVRQLIDMGFTVEIDDFGSGYSSLNTLKDVPAQIIKLDMKFLESADDSQRGGNIVESVIRMAKWLGMSVIAEGVETVQQADFLRSIGCNYMQGYLYASPMTVADYEKHCERVLKEERLLTLETVENLNNNAFWDPQSMDTLIFNSYVGAACIYEYHSGNIELLRATEKYAQVIGSAGMTVEDALKLDWSDHLDAETHRRLIADLSESIRTRKEVTGEYVFLDLPGCPHETYLRSTMRVIASAGTRYLVYCTNENITAQRKAEREGQAAAEQVRNMMDDMPGGFVRMRVGADGVIKPVFINNGFAKLIGTNHDDIMRLYAEDAYAGVHPEDTAIVRDAVAAMLEQGEAYSTRYRLMRGDGTYIWLSVFGRVTRDAAGDVFLNIYYTDASEQVRQEELQKALLDNLPGGAGIYELKGGQMSLTYQNKSYWELVGLHCEAYPDNAPMSAIHPDDVAIIMRELVSAIEQGRDVSCDIRLRHLTRGYLPVRLAGRIVPKGTDGFRIYATFAPIDPQSTTYQQTLPLVLSAIMESTTDLSFAKDTGFRYLTCSRAFARMAGRQSEDEVVGRTDYELFDKEIADKFRRDDEALFAGGKALIDMLEAIPSSNESPRYSSTSKYLLRDGSGEVIGLYGVGRDVTKSVVQDNQLRLVNDSIPGGLATFGFTDQSLHIAYCNDGFCRLFGGTREDLQARGEFDPMDWVFEADREELMTQIQALVRGGAPMDCVFRIHVMGGGYKWINEKAVVADHRGDTTLFNAVLLDVTERQNALEQLRMSEDESNLAASIGGNIVVRYNIADKTLTLTSDAAQTYALPETIGNVPEEPVRLGYIAPESVDAYVGFFEAIQRGVEAATVLFEQRYSGGWRWMEGRSTTIFTDDGEPVKAVISLSDVTERMEKESIYKKWQQSLDNRPIASYTLFRCNLNREISYESREGTLIAFDFEAAGGTINERANAYAALCVFDEDRERYLAFVNSDTMLAGYYRGKRSDALEYREMQSDGAVRWLRLSVDLVESPQSTEVEAYLMYEDIDEAKRAELETKELSETDPLTGILNRNTFVARVNERLAIAAQDECNALLMIDIDGFKQVNDAFGHSAGDDALVEIAASLRSIMRHDDLVARLGGDEFVAFLSGVLDTQAAAMKAKQICSLVRKTYSAEVQISASVGIAVAPNDGLDFDVLYKKADAALYYVKGSGKNGFAYYSADMAGEHLQLEPDVVLADGAIQSKKRQRMLIVDDNVIDHALLQSIFSGEFIIETAKDGNTALIRLRHYGSAISVVLLDLMMPGLDGFAVLEQMQESPDMRMIPVIIVSGDESRETCLKAIRKGATDFITKPVDTDLLRIRVQSAISKAENERLRAKNSLLEVQNEDRIRYESILDSTGVTFVEFNWLSGEFTYYPSIAKYLAGNYDGRTFWRILLSDMVADTRTVRDMQQLVHRIAESSAPPSASRVVMLKTPDGTKHSFRVTVRKLVNSHQFTNRLIIALDDLDYEVQDES